MDFLSSITRTILIVLLIHAVCGFHAATAQENKPVVVTTIAPIYSLTRLIAGDTVNLHLLVSKGSVHDYQLKPSDVRTIMHADMLIYVGKELEYFLETMLPSLPASTIQLELISLDKIFLLKKDAHHHGQAHHHYDEDREMKSVDPHIWLYWSNLARMAEEIALRLSVLRPDQATYYEAQLQDVQRQLLQSDVELMSRADALQDKPYVVMHDAYGYLQHHYKLGSVLVATKDTHDDVSIATIQTLRATIMKDHIPCLVYDEETPRSLKDTIMDGISIRQVMLNPLDIGGDKETLVLRLIPTIIDQLSGCL